MVTQRIANPCTPVRFRYSPPDTNADRYRCVVFGIRRPSRLPPTQSELRGNPELVHDLVWSGYPIKMHRQCRRPGLGLLPLRIESPGRQCSRVSDQKPGPSPPTELAAAHRPGPIALPQSAVASGSLRTMAGSQFATVQLPRTGHPWPRTIRSGKLRSDERKSWHMEQICAHRDRISGAFHRFDVEAGFTHAGSCGHCGRRHGARFNILHPRARRLGDNAAYGAWR